MRALRPSAGLTVLLGVFAGLPALSIDLSAPTLALLPGVLGTSVALAGLTLSLFMVGFALGQFGGGRLSDRFGRRRVLLPALAVYTIAGGCCFLATTDVTLIASRFVQGVGAGACAVQAMAIVQDLHEGERARQVRSYIVVIVGVMPMLAPVLGALLVQQLGWRSVHAVLVAAGAALVAASAMLVGESHPAGQRSATRLGWAFYSAMLREPGFARVVLANALSYGSIFAYIAGAPVIVMGRLHLSSFTYGLLFAVTAAALAFGAYCSALLGKRGVSSARMVACALAVQAAAAVLLMGFSTKTVVAYAGVVVPALMACCFARGILSPNLTHLAINRHPGHAGLASAIIGLSQLLAGAASSAAVAAMLPWLGFRAVAMPMALLALAASLPWLLTTESKHRPAWET